MDPHKIEQLKLRLRKDSDVGVHGTLDSDASRYFIEENENEYSDIRPPFFRDVDRIVHSKAYARYIDKTQVFFEINNANITHRSLHVILVSRIARQIGRVLKLNNDLVEAIALGHDVGHSPYGHLGEEILDQISKQYHISGSYKHNAQSIRWLSYLEKRFPKKPAKGLNLTLQVVDGILCHDGEITEQSLKPKNRNKTWNDHLAEYEDCFNNNKLKRVPMTYEGLAVRFADTISYIGRDIEDAILLKYISRKDIPPECKKLLGDTNRKIMNNLIMDLLNYSLDNDSIGYSEEVFQALKTLKTFNYERIYLRRDLDCSKSTSNGTFKDDLKHKFFTIFEKCLSDLEHMNYNGLVFTDHIEYIDDDDFSTYFQLLREQDKLSLIARDYIAGMSDKYFSSVYKQLIKA